MHFRCNLEREGPPEPVSGRRRAGAVFPFFGTRGPRAIVGRRAGFRHRTTSAPFAENGLNTSPSRRVFACSKCLILSYF